MNTKAEVLAMVRAELEAIVAKKREIESDAVVRDDVWQYASGAVAGGFQILRALERRLK